MAGRSDSGGHCDVLVVGAGVSGLTTAVCLAESGLRVTIRCARPPQRTTSAVAGAIWAPHLVESSERATRWGGDTMTVLAELAASSATGVRIADGAVAVRDVPADPAATPAPPEWISGLAGMRACDPAGLPPGFTSGWRFTAPLVNMPVYLGYLQGRFENAGGRLEPRTVTSLAEEARECGAWVVVNCTGAAAYDLVPDPAVTPVRGQSVVAENPGLSEFFIGLPDESAELVYVFPHGDTVILGGTAVAGDWSTEPYPAVAERIVRDCVAVEPRLRDARILAHRVGLRPVRPLVRLEAEPSSGRQTPDGPLVVHNYGHGGAGITLSWGCARDAARLAADGLRVRER
ncbi:MAG TPA: FAD-dependent oxidoreductase [Streptosporangiaceae bacterium]